MSYRPKTPNEGTLNLASDILSGTAWRSNVADLNDDDQVNIQDIVRMQQNKMDHYSDPSSGFDTSLLSRIKQYNNPASPNGLPHGYGPQAA